MNKVGISCLAALWAILLSVGVARLPRAHAIERSSQANLATFHAQSSAQPSEHLLASQTKVEPALLKQILEGEPGEEHRFVIELAHEADLTSLPQDLSPSDRQHEAVRLLQSTARQTQVNLLTFLQARQATGRVQQIHPFWIFNGLAVTADADTVLAVAAQPEVRMVRQDRWRRWVDPLPTAENRAPSNDDPVEWNIARVRADLAWRALGLDGSGVTVAIMDTGVDWQHPALQMQYRGYKPGGLSIHQGNWLCTTDEGYLYPVDGHGHGTHVAGTAVGSQDAAGVSFGVAPGARWIAVKMLNDEGYGYDSWIHAGFEWIMAPAGEPTLAPDVVNGSWGSQNDRDETFRADLQALRAAGIVPVFAAGNEGPNASSLRSPGSYPEVLTVGATDDLDQVTRFSSRGPSPWAEVKPEVVAPGVQVRSSLPGGTYGAHNGTSMASPHVTGLVALILQADPTLTMDDIETIITSTALPLADQVPNNDSGWGRIDAYRAAAVALQAGYITGQVTRHPDQQPLSTAKISARHHLGELQGAVQADETGRYHLALPPGRYNLEADAFGYESQTVNDIEVQSAQTVTLDLQLSPSPAGVLWGQVRNAETNGPVGARILAEGTPAQTTSDPQTGQYTLALPVGTYTLGASQNGYRHLAIHDVEIIAGEATQMDMALTPAPTLLLVDSGRWYYGSEASYLQQALEDRAFVHDLWEVRDLETDLPTEADLRQYDVTIWSSPLDAPGLIGAGDVISNYLGTGGSLFLTGQDVGYWDGGLSGFTWHEYYGQFLKARAIADDSGRNDLMGLPGQLLEGISLEINGPDSAGNQYTPDQIGLLDARDAAIIGIYREDGDAALHASGCQSYRAVYLAAGLEGLGERASRAEVMDRALNWLGSPQPAIDVRLAPPHQEQVWLENRSITYTVELQNTGQSPERFALELSTSGWPSTLWDGTFSQVITQSKVLEPCEIQTLGLQVTVPADVTWNVTDTLTLTARALADPTRTAQATFLSKAPAPILLVDDHRWYDVRPEYEAALAANRLPYDLWEIDPTPYPDAHSPSLQRLQRYRAVIWFTAYDWYAPLTAGDETRLAAYLDGGGRLLFSSQDYLSVRGLSDFAGHYLGVAGYTEGLTATQALGVVGNPVGHQFGSVDLVYPFPNRSDALRSTSASQPAFWGQHAQPIALTREHSPWKSAFFAFPLEGFPPQDMAEVLGRAVDWLSPLGDSLLAVDRPVVADGEHLAYTLVIRNTGPRLLSRVSLSNSVPFSTTYVAGTLEGPAEYDPILNRFTWNGALAAGQAVTIGYHLQLDGPLPAGTTVRNVASLSDESGLILYKTATSRVSVPDLSRSIKMVSRRTGLPGQVLTYTINLYNDGLRPAQVHLVDSVPLHTTYLPGSAWASSGVLTSTAEVLLWTGSIEVDQAVIITFPVVVNSASVGLFVLNRATLDDGWGDTRPIEASTWIEGRIYLPLIFKQS